MGEWIQIAKAIAELGIMIIICALFLYRSNENNKAQNQMTETLFNAMLKKLDEKHEEQLNSRPHILTPEEDEYARKVGKGIDFYLQDIVKETEASRAMVARYHNGGSDMAAVPFLKMSVTNEILNVGYKPVAQDFQNQFRSMIGYICEELIETGHSYVINVEDLRAKDFGSYEFLKGRGVKAVYAEALRNSNGYVIGFVCATYMIDNDKKVDLSKMKKILAEKAQLISALLCLRELEKK